MKPPDFAGVPINNTAAEAVMFSTGAKLLNRASERGK
jgi:hypothetical protein